MSPLFSAVRSLLLVDPLLAATSDAAGDADALILDMTGRSPDRAARTRRADGILRHLTRLCARGDRPLLLVRIDSLNDGHADDDLDAVMPAWPDGFVLSGCDGGVAAQCLGVKLGVREARLGLTEGVTTISAEVCAVGMMALPTLGKASSRLAALTWDFAELARQSGADPEAYADGEVASGVVRTWLSLAAAAAGIVAYDTVSRTEGEAFSRECKNAKRLGLAGKITREPGQVPTVNRVFSQPGGSERTICGAGVASERAAEGY